MAAKTTKAKAAADTAAPAADQAGDIQSPAGTEGAGTAPATGAAQGSASSAGDTSGEPGSGDPDADNGGTAGAGEDGANNAGAEGGESIGQAGNGIGEAGDTTVSGESVNAPTSESANAPKSEGANDQPGAGALETAQTPAETGPSSPVILGAWSLPAIREFPATLTLTNHTASRFVVMGKGIPVGESIQLEVTEQQFSKLAKSLRGPVQLDKWDNVRGLQVAYEPQN